MNILVSDSDAAVRRAMRVLLESWRHRVGETSSAVDTPEAVQNGSFDLVLLEPAAADEAGDARGCELLAKLFRLAPGLHVVVHASNITIAEAVEAIHFGAFDIVSRPAPRDRLGAIVQRSARSRMPAAEHAEFEELLRSFAPEACFQSRSREFREAVDRAARAAESDAVVLLRGERGTGKGLFARAIHLAGKRSAMPFVGMLAMKRSPLVYESELLGHVQGAFAAAACDSGGRIACAEGGTLFFHEIGDMPPVVQTKLLQLLQDRHYERVGEQAGRPADVRVIAGTRYDPQTAVAAGRFREDLLRALSVVEIVLPPLRRRQGDILPLADHLLRYFARVNRKALSGFTQTAQQALVAYPWPGNVGELRQAVERGVLLAAGALVDVSQLPAAGARNDAPPKQPPEIMPLREVEAECIRRALAWTETIEEASARLGINASTLYRKRKRYGI